MASTREIRRRIRSVRNMPQITRAMEMVSAAKMRKAQQRVIASRPYSEQLRQIMADLAAQQPDPRAGAVPPAGAATVRNVELIVITPDRGLTGALNTNILRRGSRFILTRPGRRCRSSRPARRGATSWSERGRMSSPSSSASATTHPRRGAADRGDRDRRLHVGQGRRRLLVFARFVNTLTQRPEVLQILPIEPPEAQEGYTDYIFEPSPEAVLNDLLPRYVEVQVYQAMLERSPPSTRPGWSPCATPPTTPRRSSRTDAVVQQGASGADHARGFRDRGRRERAGRLGHERREAP